MEKQLLNAALRSRSSYSLIVEHIAPESKRKKQDSYTPEFRILLDKIGNYYETDGAATAVNMELMAELIDASTPIDKHKERFKNILTEAYSSDTSVPNIKALLLMAKRAEVGDRLAMKLVNREVVDAELEEYNRLVAAELTETEEEDDALRGSALLKIANKIASGEHGLKLRPPALNDAIGARGLQPGSKVTMFGRPEIAKSAWCITNAAGWAMDGKRVLYLINEDPAENIYIRGVCCLTGWSEEEVLSKPEEAMAVAQRRGLDNLIIKDIHPGSVAEIDALVKKEKPDVLIVDQLRNLKSKADSRTNQLDEVARELRDVAKANSIVVVDVTQAGESAEGKAILSMTDMDSSKTGVPAAADLLVGIGATKEQESAGFRVLSLCKNKVNGNHATITVKVNPMISRYTNV